MKERKKAYSVEANYHIAILKIKEDYEHLRTELIDIKHEVEDTNFVHFRGIKCDIE